MVIKDYYSVSEAAEILGKNPETLRRWDNEGKLPVLREPMSNYRVYKREQLELFSEFTKYYKKEEKSNFTIPENDYSVLELFAGAGGLALGLEKAGIKCTALNELDKWACKTLRANRKNWNVLEGDIRDYDFLKYKGKIDVVTGGHVRHSVMQGKN